MGRSSLVYLLLTEYGKGSPVVKTRTAGIHSIQGKKRPTIDCSEALVQNETVDIPLVLSLSGMDVRKRYALALFCNLGAGGWEQASLVTLVGADGFANESSMGVDDTGSPIFSGQNDPSTRIPSDNTASGYIVYFTNVRPGIDGQVELTISFDGQVGHEYKGKCVNALRLQEFDLNAQEPSLTAYNDYAYTDLLRSHRYTVSGTYAVRARARCLSHPEILSEWSESQRVEINGITIDVAVEPTNSGKVRLNPEQADYDFGSSVEVSAVADANYKFKNWNQEPNDTSKVKTVLLYSNLYLNAHFTPLTGLPDEAFGHDLDYLLLQNYPNPFNAETMILYRIPEASKVTLRVLYNTLGREITILVNGLQTAGNHHRIWNARDDAGHEVHSGLYLCRIEVKGEKNNYVECIKMLLLQ